MNNIIILVGGIYAAVVIGAFLIMVITKKIRKVSIKNIWLLFTGGIATSLITTLILTGIRTMFGEMEFMKEYVASNAGSLTTQNIPIWLMILSSVIAAPIIEELFFRVGAIGLFSKFISDDTPQKSYCCLFGASLIFALLHQGIVQIVYAFVIGLFLSYIYWINKKNALASIIFHSSFNLTSIIVAALVRTFM